MMNSLFSSFDPMSNILNTSYIFISLIFMWLLKKYNLISRKFQLLMSNWNFLNNEMMMSSPSSFSQGKTKILFSVFMFVLFMNLIGLFPYTYTIPAQMTLTLSLAFSLWLAMLIFNIVKNTQNFLSHLVPLGTPMALSQFMTLIESVSQIIRPITLSVRLAANMTAGHILIALCSSPIFTANMFSPALMILFILEIAVAFIQAYVFMTLLSMYLSET